MLLDPGVFVLGNETLSFRHELLMPMAGHAAADDLAFEHAERGEQGRRAVAFVIVREGCAVAPIRRKTRLGLDLAFLVDGDHYRVACAAKPNILIVDGHAWRRLSELRNVQLAAWRKAVNRRNRSERHDQRAMEHRP
jgi:hypothetical protein